MYCALPIILQCWICNFSFTKSGNGLINFTFERKKVFRAKKVICTHPCSQTHLFCSIDPVWSNLVLNYHLVEAKMYLTPPISNSKPHVFSVFFFCSICLSPVLKLDKIQVLNLTLCTIYKVLRLWLCSFDGKLGQGVVSAAGEQSGLSSSGHTLAQICFVLVFSRYLYFQFQTFCICGSLYFLYFLVVL